MLQSNLTGPVPKRASVEQVVGIVAMLVLLVVHAIRLDEFLLSRSHAVVAVTDLYQLPRDCPRGSPILTPKGFLRSQRSSQRCGFVLTDRGSFGLLPRGSLLPFTQSRGEMLDRLREGACYEIRWFGYEADPRRGERTYPSAKDTLNTIYHVAPRDVADCPPPPPPPPRPGEVARRPALPQHPWTPAPDGVRLRLVVDAVPGASPDEVVGRARLGSAPVLRLRVAGTNTGQGTEAAMALLARHLDLPPSAIRPVSGENARLKTVLIQGNPENLIRRLKALVP